jgi:hypothetical protein
MTRRSACRFDAVMTPSTSVMVQGGFIQFSGL